MNSKKRKILIAAVVLGVAGLAVTGTSHALWNPPAGQTLKVVDVSVREARLDGVFGQVSPLYVRFSAPLTGGGNCTDNSVAVYEPNLGVQHNLTTLQAYLAAQTLRKVCGNSRLPRFSAVARSEWTRVQAAISTDSRE
jgi:hypothetical protein